ncbi:NifB/NifX family molybdenum-iron cluster-binding protein [Anaerosphaera multitolerans]|uniref:DUF134 domain-containing protein n=1 Tax=Anaerosphaera multitolerans TaxID=2487351 RepID=A0A437S658_9FIRM|nr:NifB/NifX family molybdenum-iron cluster-binding protein [Anaerosphaera multitolerans]RVU54484.1 DUF134 domain-containing protein [Anaerosphaera multitolerans]
MARQIQNKIIRSQPSLNSWSPSDEYKDLPNSKLILHLEEWECLRLVDYMSLSQQEAAASMEISRQSVQYLLQSARKKVARALVEGIPLLIDGGNYELLLEENTNIERKNEMKVAVTFENEKVFPHFGRTPFFAIYEIENGNIVEKSILETPASGHGALVDFLTEKNIEALICGGIGGGAVNALREAGISIYAGATGSADEQVNSFIKGQLTVNMEANCNHHHEHHHKHNHNHRHENGGECQNHKHNHNHNHKHCHGH